MGISETCQDFTRLKLDIPKYFNGSSLFTDVQKLEWEALLNVKSTFYSSIENVFWPLLSLKELKKGINSDSARQIASHQVNPCLHELQVKIAGKDRPQLREVFNKYFTSLY